MSFIASAFLLAVVTSVACSLPGVFVVLRRQSMLVDAMSHAVLPGIVMGVVITGTLQSPLMIALATLMGLAIVWCSNWLRRASLLIGEADQGVLFPALFSLGVLLLSTTYSNTHICTETVLAGDLNLMALRSQHIFIGGISVGPRAMWTLIGVSALNIAFIARYRRVLCTAIFDPQYARSIGMPVRRIDNVFMTLVALTVVTAFSVAGSILVVALMICPAATALLITRDIRSVIPATVITAVLSAIAGFAIAWKAELPTSVTMALIDGILFILVAIVWMLRTPRRIRMSTSHAQGQLPNRP